MDAHLIKTLETHSPPSDPVDLQQTLGGCSSSPNSPKQKALDDDYDDYDDHDLGHLPSCSLQSNIGKSSDFDSLLVDESTDDTNSDSTILLDDEPNEEEVEEVEENYHLLSWPFGTFDKPHVLGPGLANLGNTCFLNAVLQCIMHTVPLVQSLKSCNHAMPCERNIEGFCVICSLRDLIEVSAFYTGWVFSPWELVNNLSYISSSFRRFQQEDAHEFLQCFLDRLESCHNYSNQKDRKPVDNFVKQVFGGRLVSTIQCCNCGHCSDTLEPLIDLSLEIDDVGTLSSALDSFTKVEKIDDPETKLTCENCKDQVSVEKQLMLDQAPSVTAFHLKRFKNDGSFVEKIDKHVDFPLELDLLPYTSGRQNNNVDLKYDLYAVLVHVGFSSTFGHYYCFIRSAPGTWYKFDDSKVFRVPEDFVLSQEAYILFYAKQGTAWFSSFMETQKPFMDPSISNTSPKSVLDNVDHIRTSSSGARNNPSGDVNETSDGSNRICTESSTGSRHDRVEVSKSMDKNSHKTNTPAPLGASNSSGETSRNVDKIFSPSALKENQCNNAFEVKMNTNMSRQTPAISPCPEVDAREICVSIPCNHPKTVDHVPCKRKLDKDLEDSEKQACRLIKSTPSCKGSKLTAAFRRGPYNEGSQNKKKIIEMSPDRNVNHSNSRHKPDFTSVTRPMAAGSFR